MGIKSLFDKLGKRGREPAVEEAPQPAASGPPASIGIDNPLDGLSIAYLFPLEFSVGNVPVRVRILRLEAGTGPKPGATAGADAGAVAGSAAGMAVGSAAGVVAAAGAPAAPAPSPEGPWFFWKAETPSGKLGCLWQLPGPAEDAATMATWEKTATALAAAAAAKLKETLAAAPGLTPASFSAGPCKPPALGAKYFRADFRYAARGAFREGNVYTSTGYPIVVAKSLGVASAGKIDDPLGTMLLCSKAMLGTAPENVWRSRVFLFKDAGIERSYLPVYELLNLLPEQDLRLVLQNNLAVGPQSDTLGSLFMYKTTVKTDSGIGERVVPPHSFDRMRVDPLLPLAVFEDNRLDPANAAPDLQAFLLRNDEAYEELFKALRKDTLALSSEGAGIVKSIYVAQVYVPKRRSFDAFVSARDPMTQIRGLPGHLARRAVDASDAQALAAAVYGSKEDLNFVARWCSRRKREAIADELKRLDRSLSEGIADLEAVIVDRFALLEKAKEAGEADAKEKNQERTSPR